ncbi:carbamoyltransferase C-terminal domain-containing protein [Sulfurovum sp. AR]|uniref:carbamoyltransferase C-terminal domain-containing protein n=1 Tax=Sulfurovum sp. AR TaxID=1165841 RepID=UPI00025C4F11|nr:carbamoyltransferase C-terminal domain-containing protein [Sulfurovum sp. AR]EIF51152.1 hypothetical protein SULAR_04658 [Sulfurovum sp. AR]
MKIIGTNFFGHDSAIFYIDTIKKEIFAISTERVTRIKHDWLDISPILEKYAFSDIDYVCHGYGDFDEPIKGDLRIERLIALYQGKAHRKLLRPTYVKDLSPSRTKKLSILLSALFTRPKDVKNYMEMKNKKYTDKFIKQSAHLTQREIMDNYILGVLESSNIKPKKIDYFDHHLTHAVGAYYFSPFAFQHKALSLTIDGWGDGFFSKVFVFDGNQFDQIGQSKIAKVDSSNLGFSHNLSSIGVLYGNFTEALGLRRASDEGKVEALAAFAEKDEVLYDELVAATRISAEGIGYDVEAIKPFYNMEYLKNQIQKIGEKSFAAVIQSYLEDTVVDYLNMLAEHQDIEYLCLSGGTAANIIMSLNIYERTKFKHIFVMPPMGDEGIAVGSALLKALEMGEDISWVNQHYMPYFGNVLTGDEIEEAITFYDDRITSEYIGEAWYKDAAKTISEDKIIAVVHGRMEFGPRALGNRSILANPVNPDIRALINLKVKKRPEYQPFCPSILEEERERLFENSFPHKHMAIAFRAKEEFYDQIPSAIHVDGTARPQFIERQDNPAYYELLKEVKRYTGFGVVINTSFNLHGRTIVHTAKDAILDFLDCNIDELYIEGFRITRK